MTWLTGEGGTFGAETMIRVELTPTENGTHLKMTHSGFQTEEHSKAHGEAWPEALEILDNSLTTL